MLGYLACAGETVWRGCAGPDHSDRASVSVPEGSCDEDQWGPVVDRAQVLGVLRIEHGQQLYPAPLPGGDLRGGLVELVAGEQAPLLFEHRERADACFDLAGVDVPLLCRRLQQRHERCPLQSRRHAASVDLATDVRSARSY